MVSTRKLMFQERVWDISSYESIDVEFVFSESPFLRSPQNIRTNEMFFVRHRIQLCKYYFFRNFYEYYRFYIFAFDSITYKRFNLQSMLFDIRWLRSYYCRNKVYPAPCLFSSCSKYVRYNRHQNMATPGMAIKAAIAKAAFTILPFSIETELRLKYTLCTQF